MSSNRLALRILCTAAQNLEFFTGGGDLGVLLQYLDMDPYLKRFTKLNEKLVELIEDFPFVGYHTLDIQNKESVMRMVKAIDKSNGYMYANLDASKLTYEALVGKPDHDPRWTLEVQEKYTKG